MGIALPATLLCVGIILTGYEAFRLKSPWRIHPKNPDDDYEFHRFGWALWGPLLLLFGALQAVCSWEWIGAAIGILSGSITVLLMMWRARTVTKQREMIA